MSVPATIWAWRQPVPNGMHRLVLLALADHANGSGECWASLTTVAEQCAICHKTAQRAVAGLVRVKLVERLYRHRHEDGSLGVWHLRLPVENFVAYRPSRGVRESFRGGQRVLADPSIEPNKDSVVPAAVDNQRSRATASYAASPVAWCPRCNSLEVDCWPNHEPLPGLRVVR